MKDDQTQLPDERPRGSLLTVGQSFGQYKVIRLLGRGGMGEVYEVEHAVLHRHYALKVIRPEVLSRPSAVERFQREAQVMNHLEHPHIVQVDEFGETEGHTWLRMPLLGKYVDSSGRLLQSLEERMADRQQVSEVEVIGYLKQILSALDYAHGMGAIHRDIKPANILFDQDGSLKIADFGLVHMAGEQWVQSQVQLTVARSMAQADDADVTRLDGVGRMANGGTEGTSTQALLGTFEFMSPEQKRGGVADARSDLYAVGLVAFRMLTGQDMPGFEMPSELVPGLNPAWDKWFKRALAQDVARRFESSAVMLDALPIRGAEHQKPPAIPDHAQVAAKPAEKRPEPKSQGRKFIGAVVVVLLILGGVWLLNQGEPERFAESPNQADLTQPLVPSDAVANEVEARTVAKQPIKVVAPESGRDWSLSMPGNGGSLEMKWVAPGSFQMGSPSGESHRDSDEAHHLVTLSKGFHLGATEVTQAQWESVMGNNPSRVKGRDLPVEHVSWKDAMSFCRKLTERERAAGRLAAGYEYTLPTEAQWEYACRAGTTGAYAGDWDSMAWYSRNSGSKTHPVGTKQANAWGLYDMHGNVWEWCSDWYGSYPSGSAVDPAGASSGTTRVIRGGGWIDRAFNSRSALRFGRTLGYRNYDLGFRLAHAPSHTVANAAVIPAKQLDALRINETEARTRAKQPIKVVAPESGRDWSLSMPGNGGSLEMKWVAPGSFQMGSPSGESHRDSDEAQHLVTLSKGFHLGATEVTLGQWRSYVEATGYQTEAERGDGMDVYEGGNWSKRSGSSWRNVFSGNEQNPVVGVSWNDAMSFCKWLTERERAAGRLAAGYKYTLPTEAQWEYACRSGTTGAYAGDLDSMAWYGKNSGRKTHAVGGKQPNGWGLYDMHGNVWEWCSDWYGSYPSGSAVDPTGASSGSLRVRRGGSWGSNASICRSANRNRITPGYRSYFLGFRLAHRPVQ